MKQTSAAALSGAAMAAGLAWPSVREAVEASMALHMLIQIPVLVLAGVLVAAALPTRIRHLLQSCNAHGLSGWIFASLALAFWMLPRALDEAVAESWVDIAKFGVLVATGLAIRLSWAVSRPIVQLFFIGNWAWMSATVGLLYVDAPQRLCNAYLASDQVLSGYGLVIQAALVPILWGNLYRHRGKPK